MCDGFAFVFYALFCSILHLFHPFHYIPVDFWWMLWQNVHTEHYWFLTPLLKRPGPLIGQVGSMSHLSVFSLPQMGSTMWSHHLRKLSALMTKGRSEATVRLAAVLVPKQMKRSCNETDMLLQSTVIRYVFVRIRRFNCGFVNQFQAHNPLNNIRLWTYFNSGYSCILISVL